MRKLGIAIVVVVLLLAVGALIIPHVVDVNSYHNQIQTQLEKKLGRQVSLGEMRLSLFPPSFQVQNAVIGEDRAFTTGRPFAEVERLSVSVKLFPLLRKQVDINSSLALSLSGLPSSEFFARRWLRSCLGGKHAGQNAGLRDIARPHFGPFASTCARPFLAPRF